MLFGPRGQGPRRPADNTVDVDVDVDVAVGLIGSDARRRQPSWEWLPDCRARAAGDRDHQGLVVPAPLGQKPLG